VPDSRIRTAIATAASIAAANTVAVAAIAAAIAAAVSAVPAAACQQLTQQGQLLLSFLQRLGVETRQRCHLTHTLHCLAATWPLQAQP
jgi:hypothetical protein